MKQRFFVGVSMGVLVLTLPCLVQAQPSSNLSVRPTLASLAPIAVTQADRDRMTRSLVSVQTISVFRDRGVLDARQQERIAGLERNLAAALAARDTATTNTAQSQVVLEQARTAFDAEVTTLTTANQGLLREIEALRNETLVQVTRLSDEEVRQRQRFADGDTRALDIMDQLATQREAAIDLAAKQRRAESRRDMARQFATAVGRGDTGRTSADVLARWDEAADLDPSDFWQHIERTRLNLTLGASEKARQAAQQAVGAATTNRDRSVAQGELGDILVAQGDGPGALVLYQASLEVDRALALADPRSTRAEGDMAVSLSKVADIKAAQGDLAGALALYQESLEIFRTLARADPSFGQAKRDVSVGLTKVADTKAAQGDGSGTLALYQESLEITRALSLADPRSAVAKRDVSVALNRFARIKAAQGDGPEALALYEESLHIARALALADPRSAAAKRDMTVSLDNVASIKAVQGDKAGALALYQESLEIKRALVLADPRSVEAKRGVSVGLTNVADIKTAQRDGPGALVLYQASLEVDRALALADPRSTRAKRDVGVSLARLADIAPSQVRWQQVYDHFLAMQRDGSLAVGDESFLADFKRQADEQNRTSPVRPALP
jgi:tetratricopeptide (TPR) repeat protein